MEYTLPCEVWDTGFSCSICISVLLNLPFAVPHIHSSISTFACVQGKDLEEVKEATVSGRNKSNASSNSN